MVTQAIEIVGKLGEYCGPPLIRQTDYVISAESYVTKLRAALKELDAAVTKLQRKIDYAKNSGYGIEKDVLEWLKEVKKCRDSMWDLTSGNRCTRVDCFNGRVKIPNPVERHRLARQAFKGTLEVNAYCTKAKEKLEEGFDPIHHHVGGTSAIKTVDIETHTRLIKKVFKVLEGSDDAGCIIGIFGIRRVGKSTVVRTIAAKARDSGRYAKVDIIMFSTISNLHASILNSMVEAEVTDDQNKAKKKNQIEQKPNDKKAADEKTGDDKKRKEDQKENQAKENAALDWKAANKGDNDTKYDDNHPAPGNKKVLIIINDLSGKIDLATYIDNGMRKNLKVQFLVTSKTSELLSSINCHPILPLNALSNSEALELLTRLVGPDKAAKLGNNIRTEELGKRCGGLPFYIEALAQIIKRSNAGNIWEDALNQLPRNLDSVDTILEMTYKQLDDQVKFLFSLSTVLGGQTFHVQHLFRNSVGMGLFDKVTTMAAARNKMSEWLKGLLGSSLLVGTEDNNQITIKDTRRDFAVKYAFKSHYPDVFDGKQLSNLEIFISHGKDSVPQKRKDKKKKDNRSQAEIFHDSVAPEFAKTWANKPYEEKGRHHVLVLTSEEKASIFISHSEARVDAPTPSDMESFFQLGILEKLKVLHLENLSFTAGLFPVERPIIVLKDLVTLCLHNCHVKDMSGIGNLESLQVVSFFGSVVSKLLKEFGELKKLRSLDFRGCLRVEQIEPGALEGLSSLEELFLGRAFDKWEEDGVPDQRNASLAELNSMHRLATLDVCIPNPDVLPEHIAFSVLERYSLYIGEWDDSSSSQTDPLLDSYNQAVSRTLKLELESSHVLLDEWFQSTMKRAQELHLKGLTDSSKRSIHELCIGSGGFDDLKRLEIRNCPSTHYVVRSTEWFARTAFTCLEFLSLDSLINLEKVGHGRLSSESFGKLKNVQVRSCENLKSLFCISSIHGLSQLERIEIYECNRLQAIIVDERTDDEVRTGGGVAFLDKTQSLKQRDEDEEEEENDQVSAFSLSKSLGVSINKSPAAGKSPAASKSPAVMLNKSPGPTETEELAKVVVSPEHGKITMHNLRSLIIESSPNFSTFFGQPNMMTEHEREDKIHNSLFRGDDKISFPKLESVALRNIDKLKEIWQMMTETPVDLGNLQSLEVKGCSSLLSIFHPNLFEKCLQKLELLTVDDCPLIQVVFDLKPLGSGAKKKILPELKKFALTNLSNLKYIVSSKTPKKLLGFENLSSLDVVGCGELEYIFTSSMAKAMKKLEHINVEDCAKMKAIVSDETGDGEQVGSKEFPALKVLKIHKCPDLGGFSRQISAKLEVPDKDIPSRQIVASQGPKPSMMRRYLLCYGNPEEMAPEVCSDHKAAAISSEEQITFFTQKVHLPSLVELKLSSAGRFTKIWPNEPQTEGSFSKLSSIKVSDCKELVVAFPATILLDRLEQVRDIEIRECRSLKVLFELQLPSNNTNAQRSQHIVLPHLKNVILSDLPELKHIVEKDTKILVGFPSLTKIDVSSCNMLIDLMPVATATSLSNLETLTLSSCSNIKEVVGGSTGHYQENPLELQDLETYQLEFPSLKILSVENCMEMKIFSERVGLPKLEELIIKKMMLKELWSTEPLTRSFWRLKLLQVEECDELQNVIPSFMLKRLRNLESMIISNCKNVEHIAGKSGDGIIAFLKLTYLELRMMPRLGCFCSESKAVKLPLLNHLVVEECPFVEGIAAVKDDGSVAASLCNNIQITQPLFWFYNEIAFPNLEKLKITEGAKLSIIFYGEVSGDGLSKLSDVQVKDCNKLVTMFHSNVLRTLTNLETLLIWRCELLEVVYDFCGDGSSDESFYISAATATAKLMKLDLYLLPNLSDIWRYDPKEILNLEKLSSVEIWCCGKLEYIFRVSVAKSLFQLKRLDIRSCDLKEIVAGEIEGGGTEDAPTFVFPQLDTLEIMSLEKLKSFSTGVYTVECPLLSELNLYECNSLDAFASYSTTFQRQMEQVQQDTPPQKPLFLLHKDSFPQLKKLSISDCSNLKRIWQHGNNFTDTASPFSRLTELELSDCRDLEETLFPSETLEIFGNLEKLNVQDCSSLKAIYDVHWRDQNASNNNHGRHDDLKCTTSELKLKEISLSDLQELEHIWNGELKGNLSFENLSSVTIDDCQSLKYFFSTRAREDKEAAGAARLPKLLFPRVTTLQLSDVPELKSVYPGPHISRWPSLKKMDIANCTSIVKLRDGFPEKSLQGTATSTGTQPPLFWADTSSFCLLKELTLVWNDNMKEEWGGQFSNPELFPRLQVVNLKGRYGEPFNLGSSFIHKVQTEKLTIAKASCEVLFRGGTVKEEVQGEPKVAHFTKLELNDMSKLINIWEENYEHASMFKNLKSFQVSQCHELITLLPLDPVLFSNLASLVISRCDGLKTLMTMPTAQSLTQLSSMKISECDKLEEILVQVEKNDGGGINMEGVTFPKLKYLELSCLKSITSFCSGECKLSFPVLQELVVKKCPWIKSFSSSPHDALISITPKLKTVQTETGSLLVQGGRLNAALWQFFMDQLACIETVDLSDSPLWKAQWFDEAPAGSFKKLKTLIVAHVYQEDLPAAVPFDKAVILSSLESLEVRYCNALPQIFETQRVNSTAGQRKISQIACFKSLRSITISQCNGLKYILTTAMVLNLTLLRSMHIAECLELVEIVGRQDDEVRDNKKELAIEFLNLETLILESSPKLERFCSQLITTTAALKFPSLKRISIKECDQMKTFTCEFLPNKRAGSADIGDSNVTQESFFCDKVHFPSLENLNLSDMDGLSTLFPNKEGANSINLGNLKEVVIYRCHKLKYVFPASVAASLVKLNKLNIEECGGLEEIVAAAAAANKETTAIEFPNLETITLDDLPRLETFCQLGNRIAFSCQSLKKISIKKCHQMKTFASEMPRSVANEKKGESHTSCIGDNGIIQEHFFCAKVQFSCLEDLNLSDMDGLSTLFPNKEGAESINLGNLKEVVIYRCPMLKYVFPASMTTSLVKLNELIIEECGGLEEIVAAAAAANKETTAIEFPNLETITLDDLPRLETFCQLGNRIAFSCQSLKKISIKKCHQMKTFASEMPRSVANEKKGESHTSCIGDNGIIQEHFFCAKVQFSCLEDLNLSDMDGLSTLFPNKEGAESINLGNLKEVVIYRCPMLKYVFPASMTTSLVKLNELIIEECGGLEEIVAAAAAANKETTAIEFPNLETITLDDLPRLETFCQLGNRIAFSCQSLKKISIKKCHQMKTFASEMPRSVANEKKGESHTSCIGDNGIIQEHFFCAKVQFSCLEDLNLSDMDGLSTLFPNKEGAESINLGNLKEVVIYRCPMLKYVFPASMTTSLVKLNELIIEECGGLEEIVAAAAAANKETTAIEFPNLETITLDDLPRLETFCQLGNRIAFSCQSLKKISIKKCHQMKTFVSEMPRSVANEKKGESHTSCIGDNGIIQEHFFCAKVQFSCLEDLILKDMDGLSTLFPASVATTLVKLNKLMIQDCGGLEEIVATANKGSENAVTSCNNNGVVVLERRLVFPSVTVLKLKGLPELKSFHKVGILHTWEWLQLKVLIVSGCPKIETLALDIESCNNKSNLLLSDEAQVQGRHLVDQIRTNQPLFLIGKDAFPQLGVMIIHDMDNMKRIWDVVDDDRITEEASPHEIITLQPDGSNNMAEDGGISFSFRRLIIMMLSKLPRLESFSSACCTFSFPSLKSVGILGCPDMKTFSAGNPRTPKVCNARIRLLKAESHSTDEEDGIDDKIEEFINDDDQLDGFDSDDDDDEEEENGDNDTAAKHCLNTIVQNQSTAIATQREERKREEEEGHDAVEDEGGEDLNDNDDDADQGSKGLDDSNEDADEGIKIKEKSEQISMEPKMEEEEDHNEDAGQDGDAIDDNEDDPDNNDVATRG